MPASRIPASKRPRATPRRTPAKGSHARRAGLALLLGTAKGGFVLETRDRRRWSLRGPFFLGLRVHDARLDPRDGRTLLCTSTGGHLGPSIHRSRDRGESWTEARRPPRFGRPAGKRPRKAEGSRGQAVKVDLWLTPGHSGEPGVWYCGTSPQGLFRSADGGDTWSGVRGFNEGPRWHEWTGGGANGTPEGPFLHSILVDPRDAGHLYLSMSMGGTFESRDRGRTWRPLNRGVAVDFLPERFPEHGQDPHCTILHPADPDRLYQQNHCGIYRLDRAAGERWERIGERMPRDVGDIGFPIVGHPTDPDVVWVFPMDGTSVWPRTSPAGRPAVYRTRDGGSSWQRLDAGLPRQGAYFTVLRQAMDADDDPRRTGLFFGTTSGEVWASRDGGESWSQAARHLPRILSLRLARFA